jgi:ABC-type multidrug transport system ATPase subunit
MGKPQVLILDEPSCGMDPVARRQMWKVMESASQESAVILTTHSMEEAEAVSTRLGIMANGKMKCMGTAVQLRERFSNGVEVFVQIHSVDAVLKSAQEDSTIDFEAQARSAITGISNFEGSGRSVRFVVEPANKLITIDFIAEIFSFLEAGKNSGLVADYSVTQNSLDQVFRSIASRDHVASL